MLAHNTLDNINYIPSEQQNTNQDETPCCSIMSAPLRYAIKFQSDPCLYEISTIYDYLKYNRPISPYNTKPWLFIEAITDTYPIKIDTPADYDFDKQLSEIIQKMALINDLYPFHEQSENAVTLQNLDPTQVDIPVGPLFIRDEPFIEEEKEVNHIAHENEYFLQKLCINLQQYMSFLSLASAQAVEWSHFTRTLVEKSIVLENSTLDQFENMMIPLYAIGFSFIFILTMNNTENQPIENRDEEINLEEPQEQEQKTSLYNKISYSVRNLFFNTCNAVLHPTFQQQPVEEKKQDDNTALIDNIKNELSKIDELKSVPKDILEIIATYSTPKP